MKLTTTHEKSYTITFTHSELYYLVQRLKYQQELYNVHPDMSEEVWKALDEIVGPVDNPPDLY